LGARRQRHARALGGLQRAVEGHLPGAALAPRTRADDDALGIETEDRPKPDAEAPDLVGPILLARRVQREQVAAGVLVGHALAVVAAADPRDPGLLLDLEIGRASRREREETRRAGTAAEICN